MKPCVELARMTTPDGSLLTLRQHLDNYYIEVDGETLMSTCAPGTERALAEVALRGLAGRKAPRVLIGGLGLGFTLGAALDALPRDASVVVAEIFAPIIDWNRKYSFDTVGSRLADPRVIVRQGDIVGILRKASLTHDAILLDVDNGPDAFTLDSNYRLYNAVGLAVLREALRPGGVLAIWSAEPSPVFARRMGRAGFMTETTTVRSRGRKGTTNVIFLGRKPAAPGAGRGRAGTRVRRRRGMKPALQHAR